MKKIIDKYHKDLIKDDVTVFSVSTVILLVVAVILIFFVKGVIL